VTVMTEATAPLDDGTDLFYRAWLPEEGTPRRAVLLFHRGHEHSGRLADLAAELTTPGTAVFAWDARGHGRSPGERGYAPSFGRMVKDVDSFVRHTSAMHGIALGDMIVVAHSVGAVTVATWVHDYAPPIRALVLVTPALRVRLYVPLAIPGLRLLQKLRGARRTFIKSYVRGPMLTHDAEQARIYDADPLIARSIAVNILLDLFDASSRLLADAGAIRTPVLLLSGGADYVVDVGTQKRFFDALSSPVKRMRVFDGMFHDLLHEKDRASVFDEIRRFIEERFATTDDRAPLLDAHRGGYTRSELDRLRKPLSLVSFRGLAFAIQRISLRTLGRLSRGVALGWKSGFDSGQSLDYVYENRARGRLLIGRLIDRTYLGSIGWRGIRQRKINLETMIRAAEKRVRANDLPVRIVDVATGCGRYVLDVLKTMPDDATALLRDFTPANLEQGRELAESMGLSSRARYEQGDAFDRRSLSSLQPPPSIAIISGLYELFDDNDRVLESLRGLADAMRESGGCLLYTGQPWHPQVEMIARVLVNRDGEPWIMRRRTQEEMDDLVRAAGFTKQDMLIDDYGIFTVSLATIGAMR
jgi:alpha-beta hydrolase superfamily lysophospholipase/SAM-dependent methyltransferase